MENESVMRYPENEASSPEKAYVYKRTSMLLGRNVWNMVVLGKSYSEDFRFVFLEVRSSEVSPEELAFYSESRGIPTEILGFEPDFHVLEKTGNLIQFDSSRKRSPGEGGDFE